GSGKTERRIIATYDYTDEAGALLYQVQRIEPKDFRNRRPDGAGGWIWKLDDAASFIGFPNLSRLWRASGRSLFVEGEKDVDALWSIGVPATCNPHGAGKWRYEYAEHFRGATVYVIPDNDNPGRDHAEEVISSLAKVAAKVRRLDLPASPDKGDVSDWLKAGGTAEQLYELAQRVD